MKHLTLARQFAQAMDSQFSVLGFKFGWDALLGFFPGLGDVASFLLSFYLVWIGYHMRVPAKIKSQMIRNIVIDAAIGSVPLLGDVGDLFFKANLRNLKLLEEYGTQAE